MKGYGKELILDLHKCSIHAFGRAGLKLYFEKLCELIDMERCDLHFWDYLGEPEEYKLAPPHLKGTSAIQFIKTSNITIHTLDELKRVYINIFSCKKFNSGSAAAFTRKFFNGVIVNKRIIKRK